MKHGRQIARSGDCYTRVKCWRDIDGIRTGRKRIGNLYQIPSGFFATILLCFHNTHYGIWKNDTKNHIFFIKTIQYTRLIFAQSAISLINSGFICDNHLPFSLKIAVETAILFLYMEFYFKTEFSLDYLILVSKISIFYCFLCRKMPFSLF